MPGGRLNLPPRALQIYLLGVNLAMGIWAIWLYAAIRPRYGPGPKAAVMAAVAWWLIVSLQSSKWVASGFTSAKAALAPGAATLPAIIIAVLVGAWLYQE